jgi:hypothetical protein
LPHVYKAVTANQGNAMSTTTISVNGAATIRRPADQGSAVLEFWLPAQERDEAKASAERFEDQLGLLPNKFREGPSLLTVLFPGGLNEYPRFDVELIAVKRLVQPRISVTVHFAFAPVKPGAETVFGDDVIVRLSPVVWALEGEALGSAHVDARTAAVSDADDRAQDFAVALGCRSHQMTAVKEISLVDTNVTDPDWVVGESDTVARRLSVPATFEVTSVIEAVFTGRR